MVDLSVSIMTIENVEAPRKVTEDNASLKEQLRLFGKPDIRLAFEQVSISESV